ncbi:MAG: hypothetical protein NXY57DRAFT_89360 [Lentinula lateritia]|nr:MAG: hypothetical protein NXY57DRAFT_89360 [Lentinula lateritia]
MLFWFISSSSSPDWSRPLCLLLVAVLLDASLVTGSPMSGVARHERRMEAYEIRTGFYNKPNGIVNEVAGWKTRRSTERGVKFLCIAENCLGCQADKTVLHVTKLKMRNSRSSATQSEQTQIPDSRYYKAQKLVRLNRQVLNEWHHDEFATLWDFLQNIPAVQQEIRGKNNAGEVEVEDDESYINLITSYLIMEKVFMDLFPKKSPKIVY